MLPLSEQAAIAKVNSIIAQTGLGIEYRVYKIRSAPWGWLCYWIPPGAEKQIAGSGPYLISKSNGIVREWAEIAHKNNLNKQDAEGVIACFVREIETKIRQ